MDLESLTHEVVQVCRDADELVLSKYRSSSSLKLTDKDGDRRNFVTQADQEMELFLIERLKPLLPEAGFMAEESYDGQKLDGLHWVIDPIDGTTNFIHGLPPSCTSIALLNGSDSLIGVIYEFSLKEAFYAWKDGGAWMNGDRIEATKTEKLLDCLLCTGFPYDVSNQALFDAWLVLVGDLLKSTHGVRRLGAAAVDMAYVAAGRFDAFFEYNLQPWDVAAGAVIIQEAGGVVTDFRGGSDFLHGQNLVCSNSMIHEELVVRLRKISGLF